MSESDSGRLSYVVDFALLLATPAALAAIHFLVPQPTQFDLALTPAGEPLALFTNAFVHASDEHLYGNLMGYGIATAYVYTLCLGIDRRRWFRRTFVALLIAVPPLVSLTSRALLLTYVGTLPDLSRGFSGVAAAFGGFLLVAVGVFLAERRSRTVAWNATLALFLLLAFELALVQAVVTPLVVGLLVVGLGLGVVPLVRGGVDVETSRASLMEFGMVALSVVALSYLVFALFPAELVSGSEFTNVFAHAAGFGCGSLLSIVSNWLS